MTHPWKVATTGIHRWERHESTRTHPRILFHQRYQIKKNFHFDSWHIWNLKPPNLGILPSFFKTLTKLLVANHCTKSAIDGYPIFMSDLLSRWFYLLSRWNMWSFPGDLSDFYNQIYHSKCRSLRHVASTLLIFRSEEGGAALKFGLFCRALRGVTFAELGILAINMLGTRWQRWEKS